MAHIAQGEAQSSKLLDRMGGKGIKAQQNSASYQNQNENVRVQNGVTLIGKDGAVVQSGAT